jgi:large subunit ribosomal protein L25
MPEIVVAAAARTETGKNANRRLRAQDRIPGVLYGGKSETVAVAVPPKEILRVLRSAAGENTLFDLDLAGDRRKVILKEYQLQPVSGELLHADFYEVALDRKLEVRVHVELTGTPVGVKIEGGMLDFITRDLELLCLPQDIPDQITVDVSELALGKHLRVSDVAMPEGVVCQTDADIVIAHVVAPRAIAEETPAEGAAEAAAAPAEGEAAATEEKKKES